MVEVSCQQCNAKFSVKPHKLTIGKGKYCSRKCYAEANTGKKRSKERIDKKPMVPRVCLECGQSFEVMESQVKSGHGIMCSRQCNARRNGRNGGRAPVEMECVACGDKFMARPDDIDAGRGIHCSTKCAGKMRTSNSLERKHPFTCQSCGKTFIDSRRNNRDRQFCSNACQGASLRKEEKAPSKRNKTEHAKWARAVILRDRKCVRCGVREGLQAHHIKSFDKFPELEHVVSNGVSLCPCCHHAQHPSYPLEAFVKNGGKSVLYCVVCEDPFLPRKSSQRTCGRSCSHTLAWLRKKTKKQ